MGNSELTEAQDDGPPRQTSSLGSSLILPTEQGSTWLGTSWIMLADIVGTSVLTYAGVASELGWVLTISLILLLCPVAIYTAMLMSKTQGMLVNSKGIRPATMGEAARLALGSDRAAAAVYAAVYGFGFLGQSSYLLVLGQTLQGMLYDVELCLPTAVLASCVICLPFVVSVRRLSESVWLCFVNLILILAVLGIVMGKLWNDGRQEGTNTFLFAQGLSLMKVFGAATNIVFSYTGHWLYFEVMADMREPAHFPRVFYINAPLQVGLYLLVACWGYYFAGDSAAGFFLDNLPNGAPYRVASALLFAHVIVAFLIKNVVLTRFLHGLFAPSRVATRFSEPGGVRAHSEYVCCTLLLLAASFLAANAVPFFMEFMGLVGGFLSGPISFLLPIVFYIGALRQPFAAVAPRPPVAAQLSAVVHGGGDPSTAALAAAGAKPGGQAVAGWPASSNAGRLGAELLGEGPGAKPSAEAAGASAVSSNGEWLGSPLHSTADMASGPSDPSMRELAPRSVRLLDWLLFAMVGLLTVLTMVVGTAAVIKQIADKLGEEGPPFSCKLLPADRNR